MTNDYRKGHRYRMKTDENYRKRVNGEIPPKPQRRGPVKCHACKTVTNTPEYHHTPKGGYWLCKSCHGKRHDMPRGKTPKR